MLIYMQTDSVAAAWFKVLWEQLKWFIFQIDIGLFILTQRGGIIKKP